MLNQYTKYRYEGTDPAEQVEQLGEITFRGYRISVLDHA